MYTVVNLSQDQSKTSRYLSETLLEKIEKNITSKKKTILYINRRGEYTGLVCKHCQHMYKCPNCDTSLTVYASKILLCHTCGYQEGFPLQCKICQSVELEKVGVGIEQIEQKVHFLFPTSKVFRFDSDSVKTKKERDTILDSLHDADIIIGTKMITTGFDFKNIGLIGIVLLEQDLIFPQYDTEERLFSTMKQLIGRAKRGDNQYEVVIQTFITNNPIIEKITEGNYADFFKHTLKERKTFGYPPYKEFAQLEYRHKNKEIALLFMKKVKNILDIREQPDWEICFCEIPRKKYNQYYFSIFLKGINLRQKLQVIKQEIILNPSLTLQFE